jgi:hypothetical protein
LIEGSFEHADRDALALREVVSGCTSGVSVSHRAHVETVKRRRCSGQVDLRSGVAPGFTE